MDSHKSDFSIYCAPIVEGGKRRNVGSTTVRVPFRGELITSAANHAKAAEALHHKLLKAVVADGQTPAPEFSRILDLYRAEVYALGGTHADLSAGRFQ